MHVNEPIIRWLGDSIAANHMPIRVTVNPDAPDPKALKRAAAVLSRGLMVGIPTDTLYGLAVNPRDPAAIAALFRTKRRELEQAVPLVAADVDQVERQAGRMSPLARRLASRFWPGPLALVIEASPELAPGVHGGTGKVAVRVPAHVVARELARTAGYPLTATSANRSGETPPSTADEVVAALSDVAELTLVLDAGPTPGGSPSTIVDATGGEPILVRAGAVPWERVLESLE